MGGPLWAASFLLANLPALGYFLAWARRAIRDPRAANFRSTMRMRPPGLGLYERLVYPLSLP